MASLIDTWGTLSSARDKSPADTVGSPAAASQQQPGDQISLTELVNDLPDQDVQGDDADDLSPVMQSGITLAESKQAPEGPFFRFSFIGYVTEFCRRSRKIDRVPESASVIQLRCAFQTLLVLFSEGSIVFICDHPDECALFRIPEAKDCTLIHQIFLDFSGYHAIVSMRNGDIYYLHRKVDKGRKLDRIKTTTPIQSVAWDKFLGNENSTGSILLGTGDGEIYEAKFDFREGCKSFERVCDLKTRASDSGAIVGLDFEIVQPADSTQLAQVYIMIVTNTMRVYQLYGPYTSSCKSVLDDTVNPLYRTLNPCFKSDQTRLCQSLVLRRQVFTKTDISLADSFTCLAGSGLYHGTLKLPSESGDMCARDPGLISYDSDSGDQEQLPVGICQLVHHVVLVYKDKIRVVCNPLGLNTEMVTRKDLFKSLVVFEERYDLKQYGPWLKGVEYDAERRVVFIYSDYGLFRVDVVREAAQLWKAFLAKANEGKGDAQKYFDLALSFSGNDLRKRDKVLIAYGDHLFENQKIANHFEIAAKFYAQSSKPAETVALEYIRKHEDVALRLYLTEKLLWLRGISGKSNSNSTQTQCLALWITEIFLNELNELEEAAAATQEKEAILQLRQTNLDFIDFLKLHRSCLHQRTTYDLISSHGQSSTLIEFAKLTQDFDRLINHHISRREYLRAIEVLRSLTKSKPHEELFYRVSPTLIRYFPRELVSVWIECDFLMPTKLIPALMCYEPPARVRMITDDLPESMVSSSGGGGGGGKSMAGGSHETENQAIRYLRHCHLNLQSRDAAVYSYLLELYTREEDDTALREFLESTSGRDLYDPKYALRLCLDNRKYCAAMDLYYSLGLFEDGVDLALQKGYLDLAKRLADGPKDDDALRKKLWLKIHKRVIEQNADIKSTMEMLGETGELLRIEDVLPFFPDYVLIEDFADEIAESLQKYDDLRQHRIRLMQESKENSDSLRRDIAQLRSRYGCVTAASECDLCRRKLIDQPFSVFPCSHGFHTDCMIAYFCALGDCEKKTEVLAALERMDKCQQQMSASGGGGGGGGGGLGGGGGYGSDDSGSRTGASAEWEAAEARLGELLSSDCLFCSEIMVLTTEMPLVDPNKIDEVNAWNVSQFSVDNMCAWGSRFTL